MHLTDDLKTVFIETAATLKGFARRRFQAQTVKALGVGGQRLAERELGWNRQTLRKAMQELTHGLQAAARPVGLVYAAPHWVQRAGRPAGERRPGPHLQGAMGVVSTRGRVVSTRM